MPVVITVTRALMINRARAESKLRYLTHGTSIMLVFTMFYYTQTKVTEITPSIDVVELTAWRILAGLVFTIMAMALSEMGSDVEQEFLATVGLRGSTYLWAKWFDLGGRSVPWFLWGVSWAVATASALPGGPYGTLLALSSMLFLYALVVGSFIGFGLETVLRKVKNGQRTSKGIAMVAPFGLVVVMMGMGHNKPVPSILHSLSWATPIGYYMDMLKGQSSGFVGLLKANTTLLPWLVGIWLVGLIWSFRREADGFTLGRIRRVTPQSGLRFAGSPFWIKDLAMLRRNGFTLFRGVAAAIFLVFPFTFLNAQADMPLFLKFFEVMIIVAASGMMFGLLLPAMDREVLWLIRITGRLRTYVVQKFGLVSAITLLFSTIAIVPISFTLGLPLSVVALLTIVGSVLMASLTLVGSGLAIRMGIDMVSRPDANVVMGIMIAFGFYLSSAVLGYMVSWILFAALLVCWCIGAAAALGVALYLFHSLELT